MYAVLGILGICLYIKCDALHATINLIRGKDWWNVKLYRNTASIPFLDAKPSMAVAIYPWSNLGIPKSRTLFSSHF